MDASIEPLPDITRSKLRSTQILTSLSQIVSELLQNSLDAGASHVDIGVDCEEWTCWVRDDGCGMSRDGMDILSRGLEAGRYGTSKAYAPESLDNLATFGFRGEALASCADICCLEIASRTSRSTQTWSTIVKGSKSLYNGTAVRWTRESPGTTVCVREAFYNLPVRRRSHPSPTRTIDAIRRQIEAFALVFPSVSFTLENTHNTKDEKDMVLRIPKTSSILSAFRHLYGRALAQHVEDIDIISHDLRLEGFISLDGAQSKSYQFLYINRHPISPCELHHAIDLRFTASSFSKHAYEEEGETRLRSTTRRSPRKTEKRAVYVLNITVPPQDMDNCLEPAKAVVHLRNKANVTALLAGAVDSFLVRNGFALQDKPRTASPSPRKRQKIDHDFADDSGYAEYEPSTSMRRPSALSREVIPAVPFCTQEAEEEVLWTDANTGQVYVVNTRTGNSYKQSEPPGADGAAIARRRTLAKRSQEKADNMPEWIQEALEANDVFAVAEKKIPHVVQLPPAEGGDGQHHACHGRKLADYLRQGEAYADPSAGSSHRFHKSDLSNARVIDQVDRKFIACLMANSSLVLIDQHAADERVRVERFLKQLCLGYLANVAGSEDGGVKMRELGTSVPVLVTQSEATRLADLEIRKVFGHWGFRFADTAEEQREPSDYCQVFVRCVPDVVADKLLMDNELRDLVKAFLARAEEDPSSTFQEVREDKHPNDDELYWLEALRWCPQQLLDLINSKACRGAIMFNDSLTVAQCQKLVDSLAQTAFPFQCAHGRPSLVPLIDLGARSSGKGHAMDHVHHPCLLATLMRPVLWPTIFFPLLAAGAPRPTEPDFPVTEQRALSIKSERSWFWGWAFGAESTVSVVDRSPIVSFASRPAAFGAEINDPILGYVIPLSSFTTPCTPTTSNNVSSSMTTTLPSNNACPRLCITGPHQPDPNETWIALVQRGGGCEFVKKVREAQRLGARAVVVGGEDPEISGYPDLLVNMYSQEDASDVKIPSTFIRYTDYSTLFKLILASSTSHDGLQTLSLLITAEYGAWEWYSPIVTFIVILLLPSALTFVTLLVHRIRSARAAQRERAPEDVVRGLPWRVWTGSGWEKHESGEDPYAPSPEPATEQPVETGTEAEAGTSTSSAVQTQPDPEAEAEAEAEQSTSTGPLPWFDQQHECAICLCEFEKGDKVRVLPCHHIFHLVEVDEWLIQRKKLCPVCKADVTQPPQELTPRPTPASAENATERTPLLET
uniref:Mismatch repair-related protein n=1 Tax=Mycena chlorophos TaxID=658473 RepID=A0ABQ0L1Z9_MYCCL|nr:mismatch repair-related protein [Mycena chlorophos]